MGKNFCGKSKVPAIPVEMKKNRIDIHTVKKKLEEILNDYKLNGGDIE